MKPLTEDEHGRIVRDPPRTSADITQQPFDNADISISSTGSDSSDSFVQFDRSTPSQLSLERCQAQEPYLDTMFPFDLVDLTSVNNPSDYSSLWSWGDPASSDAGVDFLTFM